MIFAFIEIGKYRELTGLGKVPKPGLKLGSPEVQTHYMSEHCPRGYWLRSSWIFGTIQMAVHRQKHHDINDAWETDFNSFSLRIRLKRGMLEDSVVAKNMHMMPAQAAFWLWKQSRSSNVVHTQTSLPAESFLNVSSEWAELLWVW